MTAPPGAAPGYVLVIEDNDINLKLVQEVLALGGYRFRAVKSGEEGVALAQREPFDLILMDVQLPGMDGLEATRRLKASAASAAIPIVAVSALAQPEDHARAYAAGCAAYVEKPYGVKALLRVVAEHQRR